MLRRLIRYLVRDRRSRVPYLSRRLAVDDRLLLAADAGFRYAVSSGRVRDKAHADRLLARYGLADYRALAVFLHERRQVKYRPDYRQRLRALVQRWLGMEPVDPERREWAACVRSQRPHTGHFRRVRLSRR